MPDATIMESVTASTDSQSVRSTAPGGRSLSLFCGIDPDDGGGNSTWWTATMRSPGQLALASMRLLAIRFEAPFGDWPLGYEAIAELVGDSGYLPGYEATRGVLVVHKVGGDEDPDVQAETLTRAGRELGLLVLWIDDRGDGNVKAAVAAADGVLWHDGPLWVVPTTTEQADAVEEERAWWAREPRGMFDVRPPRA